MQTQRAWSEATSAELRDALSSPLTSYLTATRPCDIARASELACAFIDAMRASGATPERTIAALKSALIRAQWPSHLSGADRDREYARIVYLCIEHYFGCSKHGAYQCAPRAEPAANDSASESVAL